MFSNLSNEISTVNNIWYTLAWIIKIRYIILQLNALNRIPKSQMELYTV